MKITRSTKCTLRLRKVVAREALDMVAACGHQANADVQASQNILARFLTGPYGAGCKPLPLSDPDQVWIGL